MHPTNLQLQWQYWAAKYEKYHDLFSILKVHEQSKLLLMKDS
jgi:hypothetical protein